MGIGGSGTVLGIGNGNSEVIDLVRIKVGKSGTVLSFRLIRDGVGV